jgi:hypothetical protein
MAGAWARFREWRGVHFLGFELALAVCAYGCFFAWTKSAAGEYVVLEALSNNRSSAYGALLSVFGSLFGFVLAAFSVMLSAFPHQKLDPIRLTPAYPKLWGIFKSASIWLALAALCALVGLLLDRDPYANREASPLPMAWHLLTLCSLISLARVARCVWIIKHLTTILAPAIDPATPEGREVIANASNRSEPVRFREPAVRS